MSKDEKKNLQAMDATQLDEVSGGISDASSFEERFYRADYAVEQPRDYFADPEFSMGPKVNVDISKLLDNNK